MFNQAFAKVLSYTRPVVISSRSVDDTVTPGVGTFIVLNDLGFALTAAHVVQQMVGLEQQVTATQSKLRLKESIEASGASEDEKKLQIDALGIDPSDPQNCSFWWSQDAVSVERVAAIDPFADLAVVKLSNFDAAGISFPRFHRLPYTAPVPAGKSLMKIGFPFAAAQSKFDPVTNQFALDTGDLVPFPIDGILTRVLFMPNPQLGGAGAFLMTSTPGLKGQSGGPTVDVDGVVWAVQSQTLTLDLDFIGHNGGVRQFLNVGLGSHPAAIEAVLNQAGVSVDWVDAT